MATKKKAETKEERLAPRTAFEQALVYLTISQNDDALERAVRSQIRSFLGWYQSYTRQIKR